MKFFLMIYFFLTVLLFGCGKNNDIESVKLKPALSTDQDFLQLVESATIYCAEGSCPKWTVAVAVKDFSSTNIKWCTGTVLVNGQVLTAKSCFSDHFFDADGNCQQSVLIKSADSKVYGCSSFVAKSDSISEGSNDPAARVSDYVLMQIPGMKIKETKNFALNENNEMKNFDEVSVWHISANEVNGIELPIRVKKCINQRGNLIQPFNATAKTSHLMLSECDLPSSAIGAAVLSSENMANGIIHTLSTEEDLAVYEHRLVDGEEFEHYALATTMDCSSLNEEDEPEYCIQKNYTNHLVNQLRVGYLELIPGIDLIEQNVAAFARESFDEYFWWTAKLRFNDAQLLYEVDFLPTCFKDPKLWIEDFRGGFLNSSYKEVAKTHKAWPTYKVMAGLTRDFVLQSYLYTDGASQYEVTFNAKEVKKHRRTDMVVYDETAQREVARLEKIVLCQ